MSFLEHWHNASRISAGLFWMAFWAFGLGYFISSLIQVFVGRKQMQKTLGDDTPKSISLGTFFGFISSSCSFAALSTTRALFAKGAGIVSSLAFLLASTNLVIELGIVIAVFLSWQFVLAEYIGGILLILIAWLVVRLTKPQKVVNDARDKARKDVGDSSSDRERDVKKLLLSKEGWSRVAVRYVAEWRMVWKDVTIGFTAAGLIAAFVPQSFFQSLFIGSDSADPAFWEIFLQTLVGPLAAFFTFIGSMGNIPLAAVLFGNGVSFAGIIAFIFSDLVVLPVLRIQAQYYGWKMALYILGVFLFCIAAAAMILHYGFAAFDAVPDPASAQVVSERQFFAVDYTMVLNICFALLTILFLTWKAKQKGINWGWSKNLRDRILTIMAVLSLFWIGVGLIIKSF